jgi:hypothetical protein
VTVISPVLVEFSASGCDIESVQSEPSPAANPHRENIFVGAKPFTALDPARKEVHL